MTGEADPIHKATFENCLAKKLEVESNGDEHKDKHEVPSPILLSGTKVLTGEGKMVIMVVGDLSCIGKIRALLTQ
jgi:magnesium-transporting ATPase (P-type)